MTRADAIKTAQDDSRNGYVQHVNRRDTADDYFVSDWFDADTTADSFENGIRIGGIGTFVDLPTVPVQPTTTCCIKVRIGSSRVEGGSAGKWAGRRFCSLPVVATTTTGRSYCRKHAKVLDREREQNPTIAAWATTKQLALPATVPSVGIKGATVDERAAILAQALQSCTGSVQVTVTDGQHVAVAPSTVRLSVPRSAVRIGDVLVDAIGRPFFRVTEVHQARRRGYVVFFGDVLTKSYDGQSAGGHRTGIVTIDRKDGAK